MNNQFDHSDVKTAEVSLGQRACKFCQKGVKGRTDKKFCGEMCRNSYHNLQDAESKHLVRNINQALGKNRRILESFFKQGDHFITASGYQLLQKGFHFKYFTHQHTNRKGNTYYFCYNFGYLILENKYLLVRGREL